MNTTPQLSANPPVRDTTTPREIVVDNPHWKDKANQKLSILVPSYKDDPEALLASLSKCKNVEDIEFILYDDGGGDRTLIEKISAHAAEASFPVRIISAQHNIGRAGARNRLLNYARCKWVLLLDADMLPDNEDFLTNYIQEISVHPDPKLIVGGFSLKQASTAPEYALHRWQAEKSECMSSKLRNTEPGRYVFTSNVLAHADLFEEVPFDETFSGWGWEDVDWGLRIAKTYLVLHIDNTATHLGLDTDQDLMKKYGKSGANFKKAIEKHPDALKSTSLYKVANKLAPIPFKPVIKSITGSIAKTHFFPIKVRGLALKLWRATIYAEALHD